MFSRADLLDADLVWLLELTVAGRTWRWSTEPVSVASSSPLGSDTLVFDGGLSTIDVEDVLEALSDTPQLRSVPLEVVWPSDLARLIAEGHVIRRARGQLAALARGAMYERRHVLVDGRAKLPEWGGDQETVALSLEEAPFEDRGAWPPTAHRVNATTWPDHMTEAGGRAYPLVWGSPGAFVDKDGAAQQLPGSPALCVDFDSANSAQKLLIAGHRVRAGNVTLIYRSPTGAYTSSSTTVTHEDDGNGVECATCDVSGKPAALREAGEWWVCWDQGYALQSPYRAGDAVRTFGEAIRWWLDRSTLRIDRNAVAAVCATLRWPCSGYVDEAVVPYELVRRRLLAALPVTVAAGLEGLYLVRWRWDATSRDVVDRLVEGPGVVRLGRPTTEDDEVTQTIRVKWALDCAASGDDSYRQSTTLQPARDPDDPSTTSNVYVRASSTRHPDIEGEEDIAADVVYDAATAYNIAAWMVYRRAFERHAVRFEVATQDCGWWQLGDVIAVTSAGLHWVERLALVEGRTWRPGGRLEVKLALLEQVVNGTVATGDPADEPRYSSSS